MNYTQIHEHCHIKGIFFSIHTGTQLLLLKKNISRGEVCLFSACLSIYLDEAGSWVPPFFKVLLSMLLLHLQGKA